MRKHCTTVVFNLFFEEKCMPQNVLITVNFNIASTTPPLPLTASPSTVQENLTVGQPAPVAPVSVVSGGTPPFNQPTVDPSSPQALPAGLTAAIDGSGNVTITGTPTVPGTGTVILNVADSGA